MLTKDELTDCSVAIMLRLIGNKRSILIIQRLLDQPYRFNELCRLIDGLSEKILTDNSKQLERDGIITSTVFPKAPMRVEYALSYIGDSMRPIIKSMQEWGPEYQSLVRGGGK